MKLLISRVNKFLDLSIKLDMETKKIQIISSWDDGRKQDMQLVALLRKYNIPAIFYIPTKVKEITDDQVREISKDPLFEIGAHTLTHPREIQLLDRAEATREIADSKVELQRMTGKPVTKFCYPRGRFSIETKDIVRESGFEMGRTVRGLNIQFASDPYETNPSIHVHAEHQIYKKRTWHEVAKELFDKVLAEGGRFEIWGHSWEIEKYNQWEFFEDFLWYMDEGMKKINYVRDPNYILEKL